MQQVRGDQSNQSDFTKGRIFILFARVNTSLFFSFPPAIQNIICLYSTTSITETLSMIPTPAPDKDVALCL